MAPAGRHAHDEDFVHETSAGFRALRTALTTRAGTRGPAAVHQN